MVTFDHCAFTRNDARYGLAIYSTGDGTEHNQLPLDGVQRAANIGALLAVVSSSFSQNGQGGVMTGFGFDPYSGALHSIVSDSAIQYVDSTGLEDGDIEVSSASGVVASGGAKTMPCGTATPSTCPDVYFGPTVAVDTLWQTDRDIRDIFDLVVLPGSPTSDINFVQCVDCSAENPEDCEGTLLGVTCTTWVEDESAVKSAVCAPNSYGTGCAFCGIPPAPPPTAAHCKATVSSNAAHVTTCNGDNPPGDPSACSAVCTYVAEQPIAAEHQCGVTATGMPAGQCADDGPDYKCVCNDGWLQDEVAPFKCTVDVDECWSGPCQNGGTCVDSSSDVSVAPNEYRCDCVSGWGGVTTAAFTGQDCETDTDECASSPCIHGRCIDSGTVQNGGGEAGPLELRTPQAACAVQPNYPPRSWPVVPEPEPEPEPDPDPDTVPTPTPAGRRLQDPTTYADDVWTACSADAAIIAASLGVTLDDDTISTIKTEVIDSPTDFAQKGSHKHLRLIGIWCLLDYGDITPWPWWCDADRRVNPALGDPRRSCPGTVISSNTERGYGLQATPAITKNRVVFAPFIIEQMGQTAYDLSSLSVDGSQYQEVLEAGVEGVASMQATPKLTGMLDNLECRAVGGCCLAFNNTDITHGFPYVDPTSGLAGVPGQGMTGVGAQATPTIYEWDPAATASPTDCHKAYADNCAFAINPAAAGGWFTPAAIPGTSTLYTGCAASACPMSAGAGSNPFCVHAKNFADQSARDTDPLAAAWEVTSSDYIEIIKAEDENPRGQLFHNCNSGFDFESSAGDDGRQYFFETADGTELCQTCTEMVPAGAFECSCEQGWGWDDAPTRPRTVWEGEAGPFEPRPPLSQRTGTDNCDYQQDNCWNPTLDLGETPCMNDGVCTNKVADYKCDCVSGWEGKQCEKCEGMWKSCQGRLVVMGTVAIVLAACCMFVMWQDGQNKGG